MKFEWLITGLTALSLLLSIANTVWVWMSKGGAALAAKQQAQDEAIDEHDRRILSIEAELKHLPSKEDVNGLRLQLSDMNGKLKTLESELSSVTRTMRRIEDHLLGAKA